jgi:hypothetical protein
MTPLNPSTLTAPTHTAIASWWVVEARPRRAGVTCGSGPTLRWAIDDAMRRTTGGGEVNK